MGLRSRAAAEVAVLLALLLSSCDSPTPPLPGIDHLTSSLVPARPFYPVHDTARLRTFAFLDDGSSYQLGRASFRSLTPALASVDSLGIVTALAKGNAIVEVGVEGVSARVNLEVRGLLHAADIAASETWTLADTPHVVRGALHVGSADTTVLTIAGGARVLFRPGAALGFGGFWPGPGRLVITAGATTIMEGDSAGSGTWTSLGFAGSGRSELRNLSLRHCGGAPMFGTRVGCITAEANSSMQGPTLLFETVTITGAPDVGMTLGNFVRIAPGSHDLTITGVTGHPAVISPEIAGHLPTGTYTGNVEDALWIATGLVEDTTTWVARGVPWRIVGQILVEGPRAPVLTVPAGLTVRWDPGATLQVGAVNGPGGLVVGDAAGLPVVLEATAAAMGWPGITLGDGALPSTLARAELRDCGQGSAACVQVLGGVGAGTRLRVQDVTITGSRSAGIRLVAEARFDSASSGLTITGSTGAPIEMPADGAGSLPAGTYTGNGVNGIRLPWADVTRSATWRDPGVPYLLSAGLFVRHHTNDPVLTLEPGVRLVMDTGTIVEVGMAFPGALVAIGTAAAPVRFTSATPGVAGSWIGVQLGTMADARTRLEHVEVQDGGEGTAGFAGAVRFWTDPGGVLRNSAVLRSPTCGVVLFAGTWTEDYAAPAAGNTFTGVAGPPICSPPP